MHDVAQFRAVSGSAVELFNSYGVTEAAIDSCCCPLEQGEHFGALQPPIGRPISNTRIYLLDGSMQPVPIGVAGEIWIGGAGVARGYLNRPVLTAERFVASPFVEGDRLYRTGDLGRYLADGNIEFLGRNDHQVKIRGFRIELGEIEARLAEHPAVREAVVLAREDVPGEKRLVAYVTSDGEAAPAETLRAHLSGSLPEYMVPAAYVMLEALPLTPNGKIDRQALPAPDGEAYGRGVYEAPVGPVETQLAEIWAEVLGLEQVGRNDNFFELGGHSLLAIKMLSRVGRALQAEVRLAQLFSKPVLADFAVEITGSASMTRSAITLIPLRAGRGDPLLLVHALGGGLQNYDALVEHLNPEQTILGIHAFAFEDQLRGATTIVDIAQTYAREIRRSLPGQRLNLAGWSFGGVLAQEIAVQLTKAGVPVDLVALFDSVPPNAKATEAPDLNDQDWAAFMNLLVVEPTFASPAKDRILIIVPGDYAALADALSPLSDRNETIAMLQRLHSVFRRHRYALRSHVPKPVSSRALYVKSEEEDSVNCSWAGMFVGDIETHVVKGDHHQMMTYPYVVRVADALERAMLQSNRVSRHKPTVPF